MKISSRLIILLAVSVNAILIIATFFILQQVETNLKTAARDEIRAHVTTLRLALEADRAKNYSPVQFINRRDVQDNLFRSIALRFRMETLQLTHGNKSRAAEILGFDRRTLHRKLDEYRTEDPSIVF